MKIQKIGNNHLDISFNARLIKSKEVNAIYDLSPNLYRSTADHPVAMSLTMEIDRDFRPYSLLPEDVTYFSKKIGNGFDVLLNKTEQDEHSKIGRNIWQEIDKQYSLPNNQRKTEHEIIKESGIFNWYENIIEKAKKAPAISYEYFAKGADEIDKLETVAKKSNKIIQKTVEKSIQKIMARLINF